MSLWTIVPSGEGHIVFQYPENREIPVFRKDRAVNCKITMHHMYSYAPPLDSKWPKSGTYCTALRVVTWYVVIIPQGSSLHTMSAWITIHDLALQKLPLGLYWEWFSCLCLAWNEKSSHHLSIRTSTEQESPETECNAVHTKKDSSGCCTCNVIELSFWSMGLKDKNRKRAWQPQYLDILEKKVAIFFQLQQQNLDILQASWPGQVVCTSGSDNREDPEGYKC